MARSLPSTTVQAVAAERGFGDFIEGWDDPESQRRGATVAIWGVLGAGGAAIAWLGFSSAERASWGWLAAIVGIAIIGVAVVAGVLSARAEARTSRQLYCFARGLVPAQAGRPSGAFGFAGAPLTERLTQFGDPRRPRLEIELAFDDPESGPWRLEGGEAYRAEAHSAIAEASGRVRAKEIIAALEAGETVDLGTVALTPEGPLLASGEQVRFGSVRALDLDEGIWTLEHGDGERAIGAMSDTLDYRAFAAIIQATLAARGA